VHDPRVLLHHSNYENHKRVSDNRALSSVNVKIAGTIRIVTVVSAASSCLLIAALNLEINQSYRRAAGDVARRVTRLEHVTIKRVT